MTKIIANIIVAAVAINMFLLYVLDDMMLGLIVALIVGALYLPIVAIKWLLDRLTPRRQGRTENH